MLRAGAREHQGPYRNPQEGRILSHWRRAGFLPGDYLRLGQLFLFTSVAATSPAQDILESIKDMVPTACISDLLCNLRPAPFPVGPVFSSYR